MNIRQVSNNLCVIMLCLGLSTSLLAGCGNGAGQTMSTETAAAADTIPDWEKIPEDDQERQNRAQKEQNEGDGTGTTGIPEDQKETAAGDTASRDGEVTSAGEGSTETEADTASDAASDSTAEENADAEGTAPDSPSSEEAEDAADTGASAGSTEDARTNDGAMTSLKETLEEKIAALPGTWAVYVEDTGTGKSIALNNTAMVSASLIKLYVAGAYYQAVADGTIADNYGSTLDIMINQSDNDAANTLIDLLGYDAINAFAQSIGAKDTQINRRMLEASSKENYTSVRDCGHVLEMVLNGTYVNSAASQRILDDLKAQQRTSKIPAGVPAGIQTANKTGELSNVENDAAIIWGKDCTYILVIMSNNLDSTAAARASIVEISGMVYNALNP